MIVSNSTVLIYLSKIDKFYLLKELFGKILIPEAVKEEVIDQGKEGDNIDIIEIERAINYEWVIVENVKVIPEIKNIGIDKGETEAISLAKKKKSVVLLDQTHARNCAKIFNVKFHGTIYVLHLALVKKLISKEIYLLALEDLIDVGFRMSQKVYLRAVRMATN